MQEILYTKLNVGLEAPVKILHITDVHLTAYSEKEDPADQIELLKKRFETFRNEGGQPPLDPDEYFREAIELAEKEGALLMVTGDVIDLHSAGNISYFRSIISGHDMMFTPGGHEHQRICRRTMEEEGDYAEVMRAKLADEFPEFDLDFESRVINGLNIITANNSLDYYNEYTVTRFEEELEKGLPIVVFSHDPINDKLLGLTESYHPNVKLTPEDYAISNRMRDKLLHDPRVITTFAGHWHKASEETIEANVVEGKIHYVTPALFKGKCRMIEIV